MVINCLRRLSFGHIESACALMLVLLFTSCERQSTTQLSDSVPGEVRPFTGTWSATGNRQTMQLEPNHQVVIFRLTGSLLLAGKQRLRKGFKADLIGFSDSQSGMLGRSVWTDERGDKVFSELQSEVTVPGALISGKFLGGTGRYSKVRGEYTFKWRRLTNNDNGEISGRTVDLDGWARIGESDTLPSTTGGQQ